MYSPFGPSNSFTTLQIHVAYFCYVLLVAIFYSKIVQLLLHSVVGMFSWHLLQLVGGILFRCIGMFSFVCIVLPFVDILLVFLLSPVLSRLFPQVVSLFFLAFQRFSFVSSFLPVFVDFLPVFPVEFPIQVLVFCLCSLKESRFSHKLISLLLVHLIQLCFFLVYILVLDLLFRFYLDGSPFYIF